jgi:mobilization protein NikA
MSHGSEKRVRSKHLTIRLSPDERDTIDQAADRSGLTPGSYARQVVLGAPAPRQVRRPPVERRELARLLGELGHVGGNLNQIARDMNFGRGVDARELKQSLHGLALVRDAILKALGRDA